MTKVDCLIVHCLSNLRILLFNDHGGGIFRLLPNAKAQPECEPYFVMPQQYDISSLCKAYQLSHTKVDTESALKKELSDFFRPGSQAYLLEIETESHKDTQIFEQTIGTL